MLKTVWNFELFAVEDSTVVEGKTVTTAYGVTVGKSIGVLPIYVFAYWVCSQALAPTGAPHGDAFRGR